VLRLLLPELDGWNAARRAAAEAYERHGIAEHAIPQRELPGAEAVHHLYVVRSERPDELQAALERNGVQARGYYRVPLHRQPALAEFGAGVELPATDEAARTNIALPMGTQLSDDDVREVVAACASGST
jgi:dTDP-3-amino-3,4,6-trideoxy-alpha-D-glucose transaminase